MTAAQPPGPGLPLQAPSVYMLTTSLMASSLSVVWRGGDTFTFGAPPPGFLSAGRDRPCCRPAPSAVLDLPSGQSPQVIATVNAGSAPSIPGGPVAWPVHRSHRGNHNGMKYSAFRRCSSCSVTGGARRSLGRSRPHFRQRVCLTSAVLILCSPSCRLVFALFPQQLLAGGHPVNSGPALPVPRAPAAFADQPLPGASETGAAAGRQRVRDEPPPAQRPGMPRTAPCRRWVGLPTRMAASPRRSSRPAGAGPPAVPLWLRR